VAGSGLRSDPVLAWARTPGREQPSPAALTIIWARALSALAAKFSPARKTPFRGRRLSQMPMINRLRKQLLPVSASSTVIALIGQLSAASMILFERSPSRNRPLPTGRRR